MSGLGVKRTSNEYRSNWLATIYSSFGSAAETALTLRFPNNLPIKIDPVGHPGYLLGKATMKYSLRSLMRAHVAVGDF